MTMTKLEVAVRLTLSMGQTGCRHPGHSSAPPYLGFFGCSSSGFSRGMKYICLPILALPTTLKQFHFKQFQSVHKSGADLRKRARSFQGVIVQSVPGHIVQRNHIVLPVLAVADIGTEGHLICPSRAESFRSDKWIQFQVTFGSTLGSVLTVLFFPIQFYSV